MKKFILLALLTIYGDGLLAQSMGFGPIDGPTEGSISSGIHSGPFGYGYPIDTPRTTHDGGLASTGAGYATGLGPQEDMLSSGPEATMGLPAAYEPDFYDRLGLPEESSGYPMDVDRNFDDNNGSDGMQPMARSRFAWGEEELSGEKLLLP